MFFDSKSYERYIQIIYWGSSIIYIISVGIGAISSIFIADMIKAPIFICLSIGILIPAVIGFFPFMFAMIKAEEMNYRLDIYNKIMQK